MEVRSMNCGSRKPYPLGYGVDLVYILDTLERINLKIGAPTGAKTA